MVSDFTGLALVMCSHSWSLPYIHDGNLRCRFESDVVRFCTHLAVLRSHCFTAGDFLVHHAIALGLVLRTYWPAYRFSRCL